MHKKRKTMLVLFFFAIDVAGAMRNGKKKSLSKESLVGDKA